MNTSIPRGFDSEYDGEYKSGLEFWGRESAVFNGRAMKKRKKTGSGENGRDVSKHRRLYRWKRIPAF